MHSASVTQPGRRTHNQKYNIDRANFVALYSFGHIVPIVNLDKPVILDQLNLN